MARYLTYLLLGLPMAAILTGCSDSGMSKRGGSYSQESALTKMSLSSESCATVLLPLAVTDAQLVSGIERKIARYQKALPDASQPIYLLERLGWAFVAKARESRDVGYYTMAEQTASCIDSVMPDAPESMLLRGHVLYNLHRFREAETLARILVEQRGLWFDFALLGDVLMERGALNQAIDVYQTVIDQRPGPHAYARVAQLRWFEGDLEGALEMMVMAARATSPRTPEPAAWVHVRLALLLIQIDELTAADAVLDRALALQPEYPPALHMKGRLRLAQGRFEDALLPLERAVEADPQPEFRWTLYEALRIAGREIAADDQKSALIERGEIEDPRTLALFLATLGGEPETALRLALLEQQRREDVFTLDAVAWALSGAGKNEAALEHSRRVLAVGTQNPRFYFHAGIIAARAGDRVQALELLGKAKASQRLLLPSEQQQISKEFATLQPQITNLVDG